MRGYTRRDILRTSLLLGATAYLTPRVRATADERNAAATRSIDVHHHVLPPEYVAGERARIEAVTPGFVRVLEWTPQWSLDELDRAGAACAMLSLSSPGVWFGEAAPARRLARVCNDYIAKAVSDHPRRFGAFAVIPLPDTEGSLREIEYALDTLRADGIGLMTSYGERWLGDPAFTPVFDELDRRAAVVYVHPTAATCCAHLQAQVPPAFLEFPFDTTRAVTQLLHGGALTRWPRVRFIFSHGGGAVPMLNARIAAVPGMPAGALDQLRKLYYDTVTATNAPAFAALTALVPPTQLLFGSDYPFLPIGAADAALEASGLGVAELVLVRRDNALRLFPRLDAARLTREQHHGD